jgi:hypothetical protein
MEEPSAREELLARERQSWADLKELIDAIPPPEPMSRP